MRVSRLASSLFVIAILSAMPTLGASAQAVGANQDAATRQVFANWARLMDDGDANGLIARFDSAAVWVDEEGVIAGGEGIVLRMSGLFALYKASGAVLTIEQTQTSGAWGHVIATFSTTWSARDPRVVPRGWPATIAEHSRYVCTIHRSSNGKWQIARFSYYPIG